MSRWRFVLKSLLYHGRINLAVALGVAAATAVLTGALLVGDSMRGSLRDIALSRLGRIDHIILSDRFFRAELADELGGDDRFDGQFGKAVPGVLLQGTVQVTGKDQPRRAGGVTVIGCDEHFWIHLGRDDDGARRPPEKRQIILNQPLADELGASVGDEVVLRLSHVTDIPADSPMGRKTDTIRNLAELVVADIIPAEGLGRFSLRPSQQLPKNAYLPLDTLQKALKQPGKINAIFVAGKSPDAEPNEQAEDALRAMFRPSLADFGFTITRVRRTFTDPDTGQQQIVYDYFNLSSDRMIFPAAAEAAADQALAADHAQPALTYLANTIAKGDAEEYDGGIPYSTVVAIDSTPELGPLFTPEGQPLPPLAEDEIVLNSWAADDLGVKAGDDVTIRLTYFEPESTHGVTRETTETFTLAAIAPLVEPAEPYQDDEPARYETLPAPANDPDLTPTVRGITDRESIDNWDAPFPFDQRRIRPQDDEYWDNHRTTPKAFVSLSTGRRLWGGRFGDTTAFRIPAPPDLAVEDTQAEADRLAGKFLDQLRRDRETLNFNFLPVRREAIAASQGATPFEGLFLGFSFFLIAAALMLVVLLFRLGIEQRASEIGILLAVGLRRRATTRLMALEGALVTVAGSLAGMIAGVGYAYLMLAGLQTWWQAAIVKPGAIDTPFLTLHVTETSLMIGYASGGIAALAAIVWSASRLRRVSVCRLVAGQASEPTQFVRRRRPVALIVAWFLLVAAVALSGYAMQAGGQAQAGAFFGSGASVLAALLLAIWSRLRNTRAGAAVVVGPFVLIRLAMRNAGRNASRSTLTIALVASATFLIVAIGAFQLKPSDSGAGGFDLVAETDQPIYHSLNTPDGRFEQGLVGDEEMEELLAQSTILGLRVRGGDDASCLNLYQASQPRVLGVTPEFIEHFTNDAGGPYFAFSASAASNQDDQLNPWRLLEQDDGDAVPVILDRNTAWWSLKKGGSVDATFEIDNPAGDGKIRLRVVGLLADSIFQGHLMIGQSHFLRLFPDVSGYRYFVAAAPNGKTDELMTLLEDRLSDEGFDAVLTRRRMAALQVVHNTYLSAFQSIGALGLLLGTFGLATVQLRNVLERRGELALMRAAGFRRSRLAMMVMLENAALLIGGLSVGVFAALVAVLPHMLSGGAAIPFGTLAVTLGMILAVGLISGLAAVAATLRAPLLPALRGE